MKRFFNMITRKYKDADSFIEAYEKLHNRVSSSIIEYNKKVEDKEIIQFHYTDISLTNGLKIINQELTETGYQIDNVISNWIKNDEDDDEWAVKYSTKIPKNTSIPFSKKMLLNKDVEILQFPLFEKEDIDTYTLKMKEIFIKILSQESKVKSLGDVIENLKMKNVSVKNFEKLNLINKERLIDLKHEFAKELSKTKIMADKTLNFFALPIKQNWETIAHHAYIRKLVETDFLSHKICFRRYVRNKPSIVNNYFDYLGMYYTEEIVFDEVESDESEISHEETA